MVILKRLVYYSLDSHPNSVGECLDGWKTVALGLVSGLEQMERKACRTETEVLTMACYSLTRCALKGSRISLTPISA